jgi:hypothetical protein
MYPKSTIEMSVSPFFSYYLTNNLTNDGILSEVVARSEQQRQIQSSVMYRSVSLVENYVLFNLDSIDRLAALTQIIGEMAVIGVQLRQPKVNLGHVIRTMDAVNMTTKLELYFSSSKLRLKVDAFKHIIGRPTQNVWLREQLSAVPVVP